MEGKKLESRNKSRLRMRGMERKGRKEELERWMCGWKERERKEKERKKKKQKAETKQMD